MKYIFYLDGEEFNSGFMGKKRFMIQYIPIHIYCAKKKKRAVGVAKEVFCYNTFVLDMAVGNGS